MSFPSYTLELEMATAGVLKASLLAQKVQQELIGSGGVTKSDKSPVTVADYTCQALVSALIFTQFPEDELVGEEDSSELDSDANKEVKRQIVRLSNEAMSETIPDGEHVWEGVKKVTRGEKDWMAVIDKGNSQGGPKGRE